PPKRAHGTSTSRKRWRRLALPPARADVYVAKLLGHYAGGPSFSILAATLEHQVAGRSLRSRRDWGGIADRRAANSDLPRPNFTRASDAQPELSGYAFDRPGGGQRQPRHVPADTDSTPEQPWIDTADDRESA